MTLAKKILQFIISAVIILFVFIVCIVIFLTHPWNLGDYPTASAIETIRIGMNEHDVQTRLGIPFNIELSEGGCGTNDEQTTYSYSRPTLSNYPHLWVHFKHGRVISVYAKEYPYVGDDNAVYSYAGEQAKYNFIKPRFYEIF